MSDDGSLFLLALGPVGGTALYWALYRHYRNTDKSHGFERETAVVAQPVTGDERKVGEVKGTQQTRINGDNVNEYRRRVTRIEGDAPAAISGAGGGADGFGSTVGRLLDQWRSKS